MTVEMLLYKNGSETGRELASRLELNYRMVGRNGSFRCINWGSNSQRLVSRLPSEWLNKRHAVDNAQCKLQTFKVLKENGVNVPEFTTSKAQAIRWVEEDDKTVYCRKLLRANQGRGIVVARDGDNIVTAPLYTVGIDANREYRVHVFRGKATLVSRKTEMEDFEGEVDDEIRNHDRGWFFSLCDVNRVHIKIKAEGIKAVEALGLDFGAVDLLWNSSTQVATILEVNTAPALEGTTLDTYIENFQRWIDGEEVERVYSVSWMQPVITQTANQINITAVSRAEALRQVTDLMVDGEDDFTNFEVTSSSQQSVTEMSNITLEALREIRRE